MDKINLAKWDQVFGKTEQDVLFHSERYTDLRFQFEEPGLASGCIQSVVAPGMQLTELFIHADEPFCLVDEEIKEATESVFVLEGSAESRFSNFASPLCFEKGQHNLQYNRRFDGEHKVSPSFHALTISYELPFLQSLFHSDDNPGLELLAGSMEKRTTYLAMPRALRCNERMSAVITAIRECRFSGATRYLFLESKMMELFVLQIDQAGEIKNSSYKDDWSVADREKLYAVKEFIESSYLEEFSLKDLTYRFGLNEFKLKKGYKQLFGTTIFANVYGLRMRKARQMLQQNEMNVSEAAYFIGYNNVSSFCTEFRKRFGYSPGRVKARDI